MQRTGRGCGTVAEAMVSIPWTHSAAATVREVADFFVDDHVHAALIVHPTGDLAAVVERDDIAECVTPDALAVEFGQLEGRTVSAGASLPETRLSMIAASRRRAAVINADGLLLGLLCLKASRAGFCSDQDVLDRSQGPGRPGSGLASRSPRKSEDRTLDGADLRDG